MKNSELQLLLSNFPDDMEVKINDKSRDILGVSEEYVSVDGKGYKFIQLLEEDDRF